MPFLERDRWAEVKEAKRLDKAGEHSKAARLIMRAVYLREDDDPRLLCELAAARARMKAADGEVDAALKIYDFAADKAAARNPFWAAWAHSEKGRLLEDLGWFNEAATAYKSAAWNLMAIEQHTPFVEALTALVNAKADQAKETPGEMPAEAYPFREEVLRYRLKGEQDSAA